MLVTFLALCLWGGAASAWADPRGAHPDLAAHYQPGSPFGCLDGSGQIPWEQVNDDYCDCKDGSDEPGTSACERGRFYCHNKGFSPKLLPSSRVNDGICDCCDGSDEWVGGDCTNNCNQLGEAARIEREKLLATQRAGFEKRQERSKLGRENKQKKAKELEEVQSSLESFKALRAEKDEAKKAAEEVEKEALDKFNEIKEKERQAKEEEDRIADEKRAVDFFNKLDANKDGKVDKEEMKKEAVFDQNLDGTVSDEEATFYLSGVEKFNEEDFVSLGWPIFKPLIDSPPSKDGDTEEPIGDGPYEGQYEGGHGEYGDAGQGGEYDAGHDEYNGEYDGGHGEHDGGHGEYDGGHGEHDGDHDGEYDGGEYNADDIPQDDDGTDDEYETTYTEAGEKIKVKKQKDDEANEAPLDEPYDHYEPPEEMPEDNQDEDGQFDDEYADYNDDVDDDDIPGHGEDPEDIDDTPAPKRNHRHHGTRHHHNRDDYDADTKAKVEAADLARDAFNEVDRQIREKEDNIKQLEKTVNTDFGADDEFGPLLGECVELDDHEYTYGLCPFDKATQKPKGGHGGQTSLGKWGEWMLDDKGRKVGMKYTGGQGCWNGPARSTTVSLVCAGEDKLVSVSEPSKCEYSMVFETPSACQDPNQTSDSRHDEL